ncbi:hypothetical protein Ciccas_012239 [Cichlidogyrus casuarinus]|uniref:IRS-type PTB domain-containing protein n=1 Tax=Cichlidogyrus casuarinus TaxID=1844966 RepID=A0ABD2PNZ0_9PLAT
MSHHGEILLTSVLVEIARYCCSNGKLRIEAGRRCTTREGIFIFDCADQGGQPINSLNQQIRQLALESKQRKKRCSNGQPAVPPHSSIAKNEAPLLTSTAGLKLGQKVKISELNKLNDVKNVTVAQLEGSPKSHYIQNARSSLPGEKIPSTLEDLMNESKPRATEELGSAGDIYTAKKCCLSNENLSANHGLYDNVNGSAATPVNGLEKMHVTDSESHAPAAMTGRMRNTSLDHHSTIFSPSIRVRNASASRTYLSSTGRNSVGPSYGSTLGSRPIDQYSYNEPLPPAPNPPCLANINNNNNNEFDCKLDQQLALRNARVSLSEGWNGHSSSQKPVINNGHEFGRMHSPAANGKTHKSDMAPSIKSKVTYFQVTAENETKAAAASRMNQQKLATSLGADFLPAPTAFNKPAVSPPPSQ